MSIARGDRSPGTFPPPFSPAPWLPGRHLETIVPALWPARPLAWSEETVDLSVAPDASVRLRIAVPSAKPRGTVLLIHGMGGSSESAYMRRTAAMALTRGHAVVRMNCRNCGGTEALCRTLFHAGQSDDVGRVLSYLDGRSGDGTPRPFAAAGFSLGGALLLRYAGRSGTEAKADVVAAVNPPVDLETCCRSLERPENAVYHIHFTVALCKLLRRIRRIRPLPGPVPTFRRIRTLRRLDTLYTAADAGYASAEAYYAGASASPHLSSLRVPALVIASENDPFVPLRIFEPYRAGPGSIRFLVPARGGHLGFWQSAVPRFWAGETLLDFFASHSPSA